MSLRAPLWVQAVGWWARGRLSTRALVLVLGVAALERATRNRVLRA